MGRVCAYAGNAAVSSALVRLPSPKGSVEASLGAEVRILVSCDMLCTRIYYPHALMCTRTYTFIAQPLLLCPSLCCCSSPARTTSTMTVELKSHWSRICPCHTPCCALTNISHIHTYGETAFAAPVSTAAARLRGRRRPGQRPILPAGCRPQDVPIALER